MASPKASQSFVDASISVNSNVTVRCGILRKYLRHTACALTSFRISPGSGFLPTAFLENRTAPFRRTSNTPPPLGMSVKLSTGWLRPTVGCKPLINSSATRAAIGKYVHSTQNSISIFIVRWWHISHEQVPLQQAMANERIFSEQEVSEILRRAVELTEQGAERDYVPGVTEAELLRIAEEVGVAPEALRRAILEAGERTGKRGLFHLTEEFERLVEGELDPSQFDVLAEGIKPLGNAGQPAIAQVGRKLQMSAWTGVGQAKVDVTSRNGRTSLKVKSNALFQALMTLHPAFIATMITVGSMSESGMGLLGGAIGVGLMTVGVGAFTWLTKLGHRKAEKLADNLRERIATTVAEQQSATTVDETQQQLQQKLSQ